jgi:pimeloyl-ACP methyl ester carboxylesterase
MPTAQLNGIDLYYEDHGQGIPVLLTHGYSATAAMWEPQIGPLSPHCRLILWDMRGHGRTASPEDQSAYSETATVADMAALLDHLGVQKAVIGGLSLGGYMSLAFNLAHPDRVQALLLCDTGPGYRRDEPREEWNKTAIARAERFESGGLEALGRSSEVSASARHHRSAAGLAKSARGMLTQHSPAVIESLERITVPTLIIVGENDKAYLNGTEYMEKKIPGARRVVLPDAGHGANLDQPEQFNQAVLSFLEALG